MNIQKMLEEVRSILPEENFQLQPETAEKELLGLEKKYKINTKDVLENICPILSEVDLNKWLRSYETFIDFNGDKTKLNTNELINNDFSKEEEDFFNDIENNEKEYFSTKTKKEVPISEDFFFCLKFHLL